jgi:restriction endonuclease S subunit
VANFVVPVPPLPDQEKIVRSIQSQTVRFAAAISKAEREIALVREYRTRLIADVVTGKLDVRDLTLPIIPDEPETPEKFDAYEETEPDGIEEEDPTE